MGTTRAAEANDWAFLDPWFKVLKDLIHVANPERYDTPGAVGLGRDPETDWWLDVDWSRQLLVASQLQIETTLKTIREALLLTSALASADNKLWIHKLQDLCGFVPATFMDFSAHALQPNFQFRLQRRHPMINVDWDKTMKFLCGCEGYTKEFYRLMKRAARLGGGCDISRPRLQLHVSVPPEPGSAIRPRPPPEAHDISFLVLLETTIQQIQATNRLEVERPHFVLDSLYLDMSALIEHSRALAVLQRIVTLGVPMDTIRLPYLSQVRGDRPSSEWRESWVRFMGALCNHSPRNESQRAVDVGRLWIGRPEVVDPDFTIFCSALMRADNIRMLQIGEDVDDPDEEVDSFPPGVWDLIALTMLSYNSSQAIKSLAIYRVSLTQEDAEAVLDMMGVVNPLYEYFVDWAPGVRVQRGGKITHGVRIPAGSTLSSEYGFDEDASYSITTETDIDAIVLHEDGNDVHVFVDVRGLCTVARDALPAKRSRITMGTERFNAEGDLNVESQLESLELTSVQRDTTTAAQLPLFLEYAGGKRLKSLRLKVPQLDAATIKEVLSVCPSIEHLSLSNSTLKTMAAIKNGITCGVPLRSLELGKSTISSGALDTFLSQLHGAAQGSASRPTRLESLRLGRHWSPRMEESTLDVLASIAADPSSSLRYLHYYIVRPDQASYERVAEMEHGKAIAMVREPLPAPSLWAFLEGLHGLEQTTPNIRLTDELKSLISAFAATPFTRTVICSDSFATGHGRPGARARA